MWLYHRVMSPNIADGIANSVDPERSDLGLHCLPGISVRKLRVITVRSKTIKLFHLLRVTDVIRGCRYTNLYRHTYLSNFVSSWGRKINGPVAKKNICCFRFQLWKNYVWSVDITFYFVKIFYIEIAFFNIFFLIFPANLTTFCSQFTIKCLGSGQRPR